MPRYGKALSRARHWPDGTSGRARLHSASLVILLSTTTTPTRCQESICLVCIKQTVALSDAQIRAAHSFASLARWAALCCAASCHASWRRLQRLSKRRASDMGDNPRAERIVERLQGLLLQVDIAQIIIHEADEPNALVDLLEAKRLTGKNHGDVDLLAVQANAPASRDENFAIMERISQLGQAAIRAQGSRVDLSRALHVQSFVRAFAVEFADEVIEFCLLLQAVSARRSGGLLLESEMQALVASVLLRMAGLDALDLNAEPEPPHRKLREVEQGIRALKHPLIFRGC